MHSYFRGLNSEAVRSRRRLRRLPHQVTVPKLLEGSSEWEQSCSGIIIRVGSRSSEEKKSEYMKRNDEPRVSGLPRLLDDPQPRGASNNSR